MDHPADFCVLKRQVKPQNNAARERSRVKTLRSAFLDLQRSLPAVPPNTKLSKLDILVLATAYIFHLTRSLENDDLQEASTSISREHHRSSRSTAQSERSHATEAHSHQETSISVATSSGKAYTSLTTERVGKHKRIGCYEQFTPSSKCPSFAYTSRDGDTAFQCVHFSQATRAPVHASVSGNQGNHPLKGTVGFLHPVKKWPMRSRLYDSILGCTANTGIMPSSRSATSSSFSIAQ